MIQVSDFIEIVHELYGQPSYSTLISLYHIFPMLRKKYTSSRDEVEADNFFTECVNHPNTFIQGQYVFYYTECLMIQVCIMLLGQLLLTATWDLLTSRAKLRGGHVVLLEEAMNLLNQLELRKFIVI
jgi:hypothetical protein